MKKTVCLLFLLLTACTAIAPIPTATPTAVTPTASPTIEPTPTLTPTPDARTQIFNDLQDEGISVTHIVGDADGGWELLVNGEEIPGTFFDEEATELQLKYQIKDGDKLVDQVIKIPAGEVLDRLSLTEDNVLVLKATENNPVLAYGVNITAEKLAGKWFMESDVLGTAEAPVVIGDRFQDHFDWIAAEKAVVLKPFPADVYYPDPGQILKEYRGNNSVNPGNPETGFTGSSPFGVLPREELGRSPFKIVNYKILEPNEEEERKDFALIVAEQVYDPSDPEHMQELNFVDCDDLNGFNNLEEAVKVPRGDYFWYNREGLYGLPAYYLMGRDFIGKHERLKNNLLFLEEYGYVSPNGDIDVNGIKGMIDDWLENGHISPELEGLWASMALKVINEERIK